MELVPGFVALLQGLSATMTSPSFASLTTVLTGWVFAGRRTVTRMILSAGSSADKHYSSHHRLFSAARWSLDAVGLAMFALIEPHLGEEVLLGLDDALCRKRGAKMFGAGMHHDPLLSSRAKAIVNWGHSWVALGVIVELPFRRGHWCFLPLLFRLYLNKKSAAKHRRVYRTRPELAVEMLAALCGCRKNRRFHAVADSAYGGQSVLKRLPANCDLTSRLLLDARLYEASPARRPGQKGRPRKRGDRLPSPGELLDGRCPRLSLNMYGRTEEARVANCQARVYAAPQDARPHALFGDRPRDPQEGEGVAVQEGGEGEVCAAGGGLAKSNKQNPLKRFGAAAQEQVCAENIEWLPAESPQCDARDLQDETSQLILHGPGKRGPFD